MKTKNRKASKKSAKLASPLPTANITERRIGNVKADVSSYVRVKTAAGHTSLHNGDAIATKLAGKDLKDVYKLVSKEVGIPQTQLVTRYQHLNPGMQRMNLGNVLRGAMRQSA